jgi:hypothetical protein
VPYPIGGVDTATENAESATVDADAREVLERLEQSLRAEIQASAASTHRAISEAERRTRTYSDARLAESEARMFGHIDARLVESEERTRGYIDARLVESEERTRGYIDARLVESEDRTRGYIDLRLVESGEQIRRHFDVVSESLRGEIRLLAEGIRAVGDSSARRDGELGERIDRVEHRVLGLESRVSALEQPPPRRRRRR